MCTCNQQSNSQTCSGCTTPCTQTPSANPCPVKDLSTDCIVYKGLDLACSSIEQDTLLTQVIRDMDAFICNRFESAVSALSLTNIGTGENVYKGVDNLGRREIKRIQQGDNIQITSTSDGNSIRISNLDSSETQKGVIEIATQEEVDAATDNVRAVTPLKLRQAINSFFTSSSTNITINSAQLPQATETSIGALEIATQNEVNTGVDSQRAVVPSTLNSGIQNYLNSDTTNININPGNLPQATESAIGAAEIATQVETNALVDDTKFITPAKLTGGVNAVIAANNDGGSGQTFLPSGIITMWSGSTNSLPTNWYLCNGQTVETFVTPNLAGRFVVGVDPTDTDFDNVGDIGGDKTVTLTVDQIPSHGHAWLYATEQDDDNVGASNNEFTQAPGNIPVGDSNNPIGTTGGGQAHNNLPPFYAIAYIIYLP